MKESHLTQEERICIETLITEKRSVRYIADRLGKSPSTISREIKKHKKVVVPKCCDCSYSGNCTLRHVCGSSSCNKKCKSCSKAKKYCQGYVKLYCDKLMSYSPKLCNSCPKKAYCHLERHFYNGKQAHEEYLDTLVHSRDGFDLTARQFSEINDIVSPLVRRGQSVYHIIQSNKDILSVSESTIRRLIHASEMDICLIDLPETVKRNPRRKKRTVSSNTLHIKNRTSLF